MADASVGRYWKVKNPASLHPVTGERREPSSDTPVQLNVRPEPTLPLVTAGQPVAFKLVPMGAAPLLLAKPYSSIAKRGAFATKSLWVTPHMDAGEDGVCV